MERLGIDPAGGVVGRAGLTYLTALHRCQSCPSKPECRAWLDSLPMSMRFAPGFCPNGELLFELRHDQPGHIGGATTDLLLADDRYISPGPRRNLSVVMMPSMMKITSAVPCATAN
jgi:hypothetical protein